MHRPVANIMLPRTLLVFATIALFAGSWLGKSGLSRPNAATEPFAQAVPRRIVSMAPSVTEMLFALGLGEHVVGVTRYCNYPTEVAGLPRVGGHLDPNLEAILLLRPDMVVVLEEQRDLSEALAKLAMRSLVLNNNGVEPILASIVTLGEQCGEERRAEELVRELRRRMVAVQRRTAGRPRPTVLVVIDRALETGLLEDAYVAGRDDYFEHLIEMAGGRNAYRGIAMPYPVVSIEGILRIAPEVIIDLAAGRAEGQIDQAMAAWQRFPQIEAVRQGRVHALAADYAMIPGPRFVLLLEALAERIHPDGR